MESRTSGVNSLQRRLSRALALAIASVALLGGALSFWAAYEEARELQDDVLQRVAQLVQWQRTQAPGTPLALSLQGDEDDSRVLVQSLGTHQGAGALALPAALPDGLATVQLAGESYRVLVQRTPAGERFAVLQDLRLRRELALLAALRTVLPFALLLLVLLLVSAEGVRSLFRPMVQLAQDIDGRSETALHPVAEEGVPAELLPFVRAINRLLARVQQAMAAQQRFIADAAHELRTPLAALSLQAERLQAMALAAPAQERLQELRQGMERSRHLLDQLLGLARAQAGRSDCAQLQALAALLRELLQELHPLAQAKGIDLGIDLGTEGNPEASVQLPRTALYLLLKNLLDNAIRYTPAGGRIDLRITQDAAQLCLQVQDSGPGIPPAERTRVFEPFYRLPGSAGEGSGLGLAIAQTLAQGLGGSITLHDAPGGGLCARVRLPLPR